MPEIIVIKPFLYAHRGHQVQAFEPDRKPVEVSNDLAQLAVAERWARKARAAAPQNKDAAGLRSTNGAGEGDEDDSESGADVADQAATAGTTDTKEAP